MCADAAFELHMHWVLKKDWQLVVSNMTKYFRSRIEKVMAEVNKCENQLVQATVSELEFNVWRVDYDDSDCESDDDDSQASDDSHDNTYVDMTERGPDVVTVTVIGKEASDRGALSQSHAKLCRSKAYGPSDCNLFKLFGQ
jgi:hypothetical protein